MATRTRVNETEVGDPASTAAWIRTARAGAAAMVVWSVVLQVMVSALIPPVAVIGLAFLVFAFFLRGERRRLGLALAVFTALVYAGNLPIVLAELGSPESAPTFVLTLLSTVAASVALVGGLGAFFRWEAHRIKFLVRIATAVFATGTAFSLVVAAGTDSDAALGSDVTVTVSGFEFEPGEIDYGFGASGIWVDNQDPLPHTFTVEELGIDVETPAFTARRIDIDGPAGSYQVICRIPGHEAMTATLTIGS